MDLAWSQLGFRGVITKFTIPCSFTIHLVQFFSGWETIHMSLPEEEDFSLVDIRSTNLGKIFSSMAFLLLF